ncbi:MAG: polysaccharide deacetylase family protein [Solirubrobacteraceae bacterium]
MPATVAVTFDNLGEAADLERGQWPAGEPLGRHPSVTRGLPRVLELLGELELPATFFVEGVNAELYPDALHQIADAGHEIALHGWRHEVWSELDAARERELLERGLNALAALGLDPAGFRPPGGRLAASSVDALADAGFAYCSPAGEGAGVLGELAVLPFRWTLIDAFHYLPDFADRRRAARGSPDALSPRAFRATVDAAIEHAVRDGAFLATLFHPFLADTDDRLTAMRGVLTGIHRLVAEQGVRCATLRETAAWLLAQPDASSRRVRLDES